MASKRDYISEILGKKARLHRRSDRMDLFRKRVYPVVAGFRGIKSLNRSVSFRDEWLKYGAIGYVACMEGYFRLLIANLVDHGEPFLGRLPLLQDLRFPSDVVVAIHARKLSLGDFVSHLLPMNGVPDIEAHLSTLLGLSSFLGELKNQHTSKWVKTTAEKIAPGFVGETQQLFQLRHRYSHELATKERVPVRKMEHYIGHAALFVMTTEELISTSYLTGP
jgi:hypothetical protein